MNIKIEKKLKFLPLCEKDYKEFLSMSLALWTDKSKEIMTKEFERILTAPNEACFICKIEEEVIGYILISLRVDYVPKATSRPVAYLEGIYVKDNYRKHGIAKKLYEQGVKWAKSKGCNELASDTWDWNKVSIEFHKKLGFDIAYTLVHFIKKI